MSSDSKARKEAREHGFDDAKFIAKDGEDKIYMATMDDSRPTGLPLFIRISPNGNVTSGFSLEHMDLVKE